MMTGPGNENNAKRKKKGRKKEKESNLNKAGHSRANTDSVTGQAIGKTKKKKKKKKKKTLHETKKILYDEHMESANLQESNGDAQATNQTTSKKRKRQESPQRSETQLSHEYKERHKHFSPPKRRHKEYKLEASLEKHTEKGRWKRRHKEETPEALLEKYIEKRKKKDRWKRAVAMLAPVGTYKKYWAQKYNKEDGKKAYYSKVESLAVMIAVQDHLQEHPHMTVQMLVHPRRSKTDDLSKEEKESQKNSWLSIASRLEKRHAQSVRAHFRAKINDYKEGPWEIEEVELLLEYVEEHGKKWTLIAKELNRSPIDIRCKYRELGDFDEGRFSISETNKLLDVVKKCCNLPESASMEEILFAKDIAWEVVGKKMETRSRISSLKHFLALKLKYLRDKKNAHRGGFWQIPYLKQLERDVDFLTAIQDTGAESESEIVWTWLYNETNQYGRSRWNLLKRSAPTDMKFQEKVESLLQSRQEECTFFRWQKPQQPSNLGP